MAELITALIDIALGAYAYRLASENRKKIAAVALDVAIIKTALKKVGLLDNDGN